VNLDLRNVAPNSWPIIPRDGWRLQIRQPRFSHLDRVWPVQLYRIDSPTCDTLLVSAPKDCFCWGYQPPALSAPTARVEIIGPDDSGVVWLDFFCWQTGRPHVDFLPQYYVERWNAARSAFMSQPIAADNIHRIVA
jgi:hypothetical protein